MLGHHTYLKRGTQVRASAKLSDNLKKTSVILCCSITLNSGCECLIEAISYVCLVDLDIIWKFFVYIDFLFVIKKKIKQNIKRILFAFIPEGGCRSGSV